ncbi:MAG: hypothetical protein EA401_14385, partial [Planctomycetota bacterium]
MMTRSFFPAVLACVMFVLLAAAAQAEDIAVTFDGDAANDDHIYATGALAVNEAKAITIEMTNQNANDMEFAFYLETSDARGVESLTLEEDGQTQVLPGDGSISRSLSFTPIWDVGWRVVVHINDINYIIQPRTGLDTGISVRRLGRALT